MCVCRRVYLFKGNESSYFIYYNIVPDYNNIIVNCYNAARIVNPRTNESPELL